MSGWLLNISKYGVSITSLEYLCQCSDILTVKKKFCHVEMEPPVFQFVPSVSCPVTGHH